VASKKHQPVVRSRVWWNASAHTHEMTYVIININISVTLHIREWKFMRSKTRFAILAVVLIALVSLVPSARANPGPHVAVPQSPLSIGQPVYITYYTDPGEDGTAIVCIGKTDTTCLSGEIWDSGWITITGGLAYDVTAPGLSTPGTYYAGVDFCQNSPGPCSNMKYMHQAFHVVGSTTTTTTPTLATDWAVLSVSLSPSAPYVGDQVTFSMVMTALSSPAPFPQSFAAVCQIDGVSCGGGSLTYPGPMGTPLTVSAQTPWIATLGTHTLIWGVATIPVGLDPDKSNNMKSITFTVAQSSSQQTTTASSTASQAPDFQVNASPPSQTVLQGATISYAVDVVALNGFNSQVSLSVSGLPSGANGVFSNPSGTPNFASTLTVTLSGDVATGSYALTVIGSGAGLSHVANLVLTVNAATVTQTSASPTETSASSTQTSSDLMSMIQQNQLLILGAVVLLAAVLIAVALRGRRKPTPTQPTGTGTTPGMVYCGKCGTQNPTANEFCATCGTKLH
jgi:hypothetical protein